jgi:hypothetical protein
VAVLQSDNGNFAVCSQRKEHWPGHSKHLLVSTMCQNMPVRSPRSFENNLSLFERQSFNRFAVL